MQAQPLLAVAAAVLVAGCGADRTVAATTTTAVARSTTAPSTARPADPALTGPLIDRVEWTTTRYGRELQVFATRAGREDIDASAQNRAWREVLARAPDAASPGMFDQFACHWALTRLVAEDKPSWNLEPWRPDVGYQATVAALCNPGGPEN